MRKPVRYEGHDCRFGASIGIAIDSGSTLDAKQMLLDADIALYRAKGLGRNRFEFFSASARRDIISAKHLADEILIGLERNEFVPFYQLQFDARTLDVAGIETLARWQHPVHGLLTPDRFLDIAEDLDVVSTIDALILERALADRSVWIKDGLSIPKISVNVSARRLADPDLGKKLRALKIEPGTISFELLESISLDDCDEAVAANLKKLRKLGIDIQIDDFGTGHASIVSLLRLSPKTLKIDRELIRMLPQSSEQRKLVGSIIDIGRSLNILVIAEGVETVDHIRILEELDCDTLQGYALARPMPKPCRSPPSSAPEAGATGKSPLAPCRRNFVARCEAEPPNKNLHKRPAILPSFHGRGKGATLVLRIHSILLAVFRKIGNQAAKSGNQGRSDRRIVKPSLFL